MGKLATLLLYVAVAWFYVSVDDYAPGLFIAYISGVPGIVAYYVVGFQYYGDVRDIVTDTGRNDDEMADK